MQLQGSGGTRRPSRFRLAKHWHQPVVWEHSRAALRSGKTFLQWRWKQSQGELPNDDVLYLQSTENSTGEQDQPPTGTETQDYRFALTAVIRAPVYISIFTLFQRFGIWGDVFDFFHEKIRLVSVLCLVKICLYPLFISEENWASKEEKFVFTK